MKKLLFIIALLASLTAMAQTLTTSTRSLYLNGIQSADSANFASQNGKVWYGPNGIRYTEGGVKKSLKTLGSGPFWKISGTTALTGTPSITGSALGFSLSNSLNLTATNQIIINSDNISFQGYGSNGIYLGDGLSVNNTLGRVLVYDSITHKINFRYASTLGGGGGGGSDPGYIKSPNKYLASLPVSPGTGQVPNLNTRYIEDENCFYGFTNDNTEVESYPNIISPVDGVGRYIRIPRLESLSFPTSLTTNLEIWHTLDDQVGSNGSSVTTVSDISGNNIDGTAAGSQHTLKIETGATLKGLNMNGSDDKITFPCSFGIRTIAILYRYTDTNDNWGDYYGILSQLTNGGIDFTVTANGALPTSGTGGRHFFSAAHTFTDWTSDEVPKKYLPAGGIISDAGLMKDYHLLVFELSANVTGLTNLQWCQERNNGGRNFKMVFVDGLIWSRVLTAQEKLSLFKYFRNTRKYRDHYEATNNLILDGNSISVGTTAAITSAPIKLALATLGSGWTGGSLGIGSMETPEMENRVINLVAPKWRKGFTKNVYIPIEVSNHLALHNITAATAFASYKKVCENARAAGFIVIGSTCMDRQAAVTNPNFNTERTAVNTLIRNYHAGLSEQVADFDANVNLQNAANTTYFTDLVHPTAAGYAQMASVISTAVSAL